jgi:site-specific DNA-cytosine methylase
VSSNSTSKRLGLPIEIMVHVEHDPVAVEVCKHNHRDDGIIHHYVDKFESIFSVDDADHNLVEALVDKHGPFDLVLSGAPCQSYSGLNSSRDQTSDNAQYLRKVGMLIKKLDCIQSGRDRVLFLSENVVFKHHDEVDQCYSDIECEGLTPMRIDAKGFGPCKRNRFYWVNVSICCSMGHALLIYF